MWIMSKLGFFSVVKCSPTNVMVRARAWADIAAMREALLKFVYASELKILDTPHADYPFRIIVRKDLFADCLAAEVAAIDYTNFKGEIAKTDPARSHRVYGEVWSVLRAGLDPRHDPRRMLPPAYVRTKKPHHLAEIVAAKHAPDAARTKTAPPKNVRRG